MDSSEVITKKTRDAVFTFLEKILPQNDIQMVKTEYQRVFPSWSHFWKTIQAWLQVQPFTNVRDTIHGFAQFFPTYRQFQPELDNSLSIHSPFWNQVYGNLCEAKNRLC